jgi:hypothetical protein
MAGEDLPPGLLGVLPRMGEPGWYPGIEEDARRSTLSTLAPPPQDPRAQGVAPFSGLPPTPNYTEARTADPEFRDADLSQRLRDEGHRDIERMTGDRPGTFASNTVAGLASPATIRAFHGSPHLFDRFDSSRIGTGEGAQAYGRGLYFAENEAVARGYRDNLTRNLADSSTSPQGAAIRALEGASSRDEAMEWLQANLRSARQAVERGYPGVAAEPAKYEEAIRLVRGGLQPQGHMYEVALRTEPERLLNWDAPLTQQAPAVQQALERAGAQTRGGWAASEFTPDVLERTGARGTEATVRPLDRGHGIEWLAEYDTLNARGSQRFPTREAAQRWIDESAPIEAGRGGEVYQEMRRTMSDADISARLRDAGIPGIRYLDQGSRAGGQGTHNVVMFDDNLIDILRRYGVPGMLGSGAAAGAASGGGSSQ